MSSSIYVRYVGNDPTLLELLGQWRDAGALGGWELISAQQLCDVFRPSLAPPPSGKFDSGQLSQLAERYAPVIVDASSAGDAAALLHQAKQIDRGVPVIVLCEGANLTSFSLCRLEGADTLLLKPLASPQRLWEAIAAANRRVQNWLGALERAAAACQSESGCKTALSRHNDFPGNDACVEYLSTAALAGQGRGACDSFSELPSLA